MKELGDIKNVLKYLGFLEEKYGFTFKFQIFSEYKGFSGPIYVYSFYNDFGCFTLHNVAQKGEWGWFVSSKISSNQAELLKREINQAAYIKKRYWLFSSVLKNLANVIEEQIESSSSFFGILVKEQGDNSSDNQGTVL